MNLGKKPNQLYWEQRRKLENEKLYSWTRCWNDVEVLMDRYMLTRDVTIEDILARLEKLESERKQTGRMPTEILPVSIRTNPNNVSNIAQSMISMGNMSIVSRADGNKSNYMEKRAEQRKVTLAELDNNTCAYVATLDFMNGAEEI